MFSVIDQDYVAPKVSPLYPEGKLDTTQYLTLTQPIIAGLLKTSSVVRKFSVAQLHKECKTLVQRRREHHNNNRDTPSGCANLCYTTIDVTLDDSDVEEVEFDADKCIPDEEIPCAGTCEAKVKVSEAMPKVARLQENKNKYSFYCSSCWVAREQELYKMLGFKKPVKKPVKNQSSRAAEGSRCQRLARLGCRPCDHTSRACLPVA